MTFLRAREDKSDDTDVNLLLVDNDFKAVEYVTYAVEEVIDDFSGGSKDKLILDVKTISAEISAQELLSFAGEVISSYAKLFIFDDAYIDKSMLVDYYDIVETNEKMTEEMNIKTVPIDALPLSERTRNALIKNEILYVEDLEKKRKSELLSMK
jgi:DNA-directed RNA polymerase alpha subunit